MQKIEGLLGGRQTPADTTYVVRQPEAGDLGWIVHRHGVLYAEEYGWDARFEGLVAGVVARFAGSDDGKRERCFIAERDGADRRLGAVRRALAHRREAAPLARRAERAGARHRRAAHRRLHPFARAAGYRRLELWTNSVLTAARRLYERAGFVLVDEAPHREFGKGLVGQTFRLAL